MSVLQAVVLGAVQGLTEFIPISSSGHLVIVPELFGWDEPGLAFDVLLHVGSLLALLVYFSGDLIDLTRGAIQGDQSSRRIVTLLAIGTIPAALAGFFLSDYFEGSFGDAKSSALQLLVTAAILVAGEQALSHHSKRTARTGAKLREMSDLRTGDAVAIGVAQAISILPGISRSGATLATGLGLAMKRSDAARFVFLLAIPALAGAAVFKVPEIAGSGLGVGAGIAGFAVSLLTSYAAIAALIKYLKTNTLYPFAAYCVIAGIAFYVIL